MNPSVSTVEAIFLAAIDISDPAQREVFVEDACRGDEGLLRRLRELLQAHEQSVGFLDRSPVEAATEVFSPHQERAGDLIDKYKLREEIGEGGFGVVFMAEQTEPVRRKVALKVLKPGMDTRQIVARFEAERQALAIMDHPNIARVFDGGTTPGGRPYFVMELVNGHPITEFCDRHHFSPQKRLELFLDICAAVQHAHQKGIIHRDLKPSNVLVTMHDVTPVVKVIDFGVAKALGGALTNRTLFTGLAQTIGTPMYMSPEQAGHSGLDIDTRSDIYSLGVLLYELLTGSTPFERSRFERAAHDEIMRIIREESPPLPSRRLSTTEELPTVAANRGLEPRKLNSQVRGELDWIVMKCLEKDRNRRYETANGLSSDVRHYLADEPVAAGPPSRWYRLRKFARRNRGPVLASAVLLLTLGGGIAGTTAGMLSAERARFEEARQRRAAQDNEQMANQAADAERTANQQAQRRLKQLEKATDILGSIFNDLNPTINATDAETLRMELGKRLEQAAQLIDAEAVGDRATAARLQFLVGKSLHELGYADKAIPHFRQSYQTYEQLRGIDDPATIDALDNLAMAHVDCAEIEPAIAAQQLALERRIGRYGTNDPGVLLRQARMANIYRAASRIDEALPLAEKAYKGLSAALPPTDPAVRVARIYLANICISVGMHDRALKLWAEDLEIARQKYGPEDQETLVAENGLGHAFVSSGRAAQAIPLLEHAYEHLSAKLGQDHPKALNALSNLSSAYVGNKQAERSTQLLEEVLRRMESKYGSRHHAVLNVKNNLAANYWSRGQFQKAIPIFEEAFQLRRETLGPNHADTLTTMANLGVNYRANKQLDRAIPLLEEAVERAAQLPSPQPEVLYWLPEALGVAYHEDRQYARAEPLLRHGLKEFRKRNGPTHEETMRRISRLGLNLIWQRKFADAEVQFLECLEIRRQMDPKSWQAFNSAGHVGLALLGQRKFAEAEPLLLESYHGLIAREAEMPRGARIRINEIVQQLVRLYDDWGNKEQADLWRKKLEQPKK
jgi:eukaryotic-like serine/threonine-protein kinase